ncbi:hypothetical protein [Sphaerisporangium sp. TRM90804]|uniref:hypothetical protein n=1 Tax=Sphaerisporangium sp. TRM90804 TaxID=3031113 RepID=UPI002446B611|nr:hypothetical protein [Sphaerisporangium sp. TRM90804]MDH2424790.1 hypothetical protein [Sphaerisporangium sp. TRM90804]
MSSDWANSRLGDTHKGCRVCGRTDVGLKKDETLRMHVRADRKGSSFLFPDGNRCPGAGYPPKGTLGRYARAVLETLRPDFPDLDGKPYVAEVIGEAIQQNAVVPSPAFEALLDDLGNWRLRGHRDIPRRVRLACYRFTESDADRAKVQRINALLDALR